MNNALKASAAHGRFGNEINQLASETLIIKFHHPMMRVEMVCVFLTQSQLYVQLRLEFSSVAKQLHTEN